MSGTTCIICLEDAKNPVSIPCGHIHCEACLIQCIEACDDAVECPCPTCRAPFMIATPDLRFVPAKYHPFLQSSVRRVYPSPSDVVQALEERHETLRADNDALKDKIKTLKARNEHLQRDKQRLMDVCEANQAAVANYREKERQLRDKIADLVDDKDAAEWASSNLARKYRELKEKYHGLKKTLVGKSSPSSAPAQTTKRNSTQAALDQSPEGSSSSGAPERRLILPIPKRPRLTTSRKPTRTDMDVDDHDEQSFTARFNSGITSHSLSPPKHGFPAPSHAGPSAASSSTSTANTNKKTLGSGLTIYLDGLDVSVSVDRDIDDDEEKDGPSKSRPHLPTPPPPVSILARSQAPSPPHAGPSRPAPRPMQAKLRTPSSPWDVFGSEEGSHGSLDFTVGSSSPGTPEELVSTDEEERERERRKERSYVFRGRRISTIGE